MCENNNLELCIEMDKATIYKFNETINENTIIKTAKHIEEILIGHNAKAEKIQNVFELLIEVMQNILNYSYGNKELPDNKKEAHGSLTLSYISQTETYLIKSCNLISVQQKENIMRRINEIKGLDSKALRKLSREKMRTKKDKHEKGAGLGFIMMAKKSSKNIEISFLALNDNVLQYKQLITI